MLWPDIQPADAVMAELLTPTTVFKCLADDTRVRLMLLIAREEELCVCELTSALGENQPKVSRHLAQWRSGGLPMGFPITWIIGVGIGHGGV